MVVAMSSLNLKRRWMTIPSQKRFRKYPMLTMISRMTVTAKSFRMMAIPQRKKTTMMKTMVVAVVAAAAAAVEVVAAKAAASICARPSRSTARATRAPALATAGARSSASAAASPTRSAARASATSAKGRQRAAARRLATQHGQSAPHGQGPASTAAPSRGHPSSSWRLSTPRGEGRATGRLATASGPLPPAPKVTFHL